MLPHARARSGHIGISSNVTQGCQRQAIAYTVSRSGSRKRAHSGQRGKEWNPRKRSRAGTDSNRYAGGEFRLDGAGARGRVHKSVPLRRTVAEEIAAVVVFWSAAASFVTAQVIYVNGGGPGG